MVDVHGFMRNKQDYNLIQVSIATNGRYDGLFEWGNIFFEDRFEEWIPLD